MQTVPTEPQSSLLLQYLQAGVIVHAADTSILSANEQACALLGLTRDQISGKEAMDPGWAFLREDSHPMPLEEYPVMRVLASRAPFRNYFMGVNRPATNDVLWASVNAFPEFGDDGAISRVVVTFIDMTDRVFAEARSRHITLVLRAIRNVNQLIVQEKDRSRLLSRACDMLTETRGYRAAWIGLIGAADHCTHAAQSGCDADFDVLRAAMEQGQWPTCAREVLRSGELLVRHDLPNACVGCPMCGDSADSASLVAPLVHLGKRFGVLVVCLPARLADDPEERSLFREVAGDLGLALHLMDTEESKDTSVKSLLESETRFRTLVEASPDGIFIQTGGRFRYLNPAARVLFGADVDQDLVGTPVLESFHPDVRETVAARIRKLNMDRQAVTRLEERVLRPDGTTLDAEFVGVPFVYGGEPGALVFARDLTERKLDGAERETLRDQLVQAQRLESVGRLAGGVAHDYNNMLGVIIGYCELAMDRVPIGDPLLEDLEAILNAATRSADITRQLLAFARKQTIAPRVLDLNEAVGGLLKMLRRLIGEDISLAWCPGTDTWPVLMDPAQVDQLLANLCVNARDAIGGVGKVTIESRNETLDQGYCDTHFGFKPGQFVVLGVSDDGCGMDRETVTHIFEPFFTTKAPGEGTGLGLATVHGIVSQNGGFINVYSEPGAGTTFRIYLPRHDADAVDALPATTDELPRGQGEWVLVVEDEEAILGLAVQMLERLGYRALPASTPERALHLAQAHPEPIALLLTDVVMPGMNGRELTTRLQAVVPGLPTLFMSGYTANVIAHRGVLDDGVHFLQKPFSRRDLALRVHEALT